MPPGIPYIIGNEAAERFSYYGMSGILTVFMSTYLRDRTGHLAVMSESSASAWYHIFASANYFFPLFGAILADAFWGRYHTIFWLSLVYCCGHAALAIDDTRTGLVVGLSLIAIGAGGIKPSVSAMVGDQFGPDNSHLVPRAFGWFYAAVNCGSTVSFLLIPWLLDRFGSHVAFGVPGLLMLVATLVIWVGRYRFTHVPPAGKAYLSAVLGAAGRKIVLRLALVFGFTAVFWALWSQSLSEWIEQATHMNLHFAGITWLAPQLGVLNAAMILALIPLFRVGIYPAIDRVFPLNPLRKIGLGLLAAGAALLVSAWIESRIARGLTPSIGWQLPAYFILSAAEVLVSITSLEFAYTQAPRIMKSAIMALYLLSISGGHLIAAAVHLLGLRGPNYYLFYSAMAVVACLLFIPFARRYREHSYLQDDSSAHAPVT
jgi:POT family proton-dependent oligopeptide transporter